MRDKSYLISLLDSMSMSYCCWFCFPLAAPAAFHKTKNFWCWGQKYFTNFMQTRRFCFTKRKSSFWITYLPNCTHSRCGGEYCFEQKIPYHHQKQELSWIRFQFISWQLFQQQKLPHFISNVLNWTQSLVKLQGHELRCHTLSWVNIFYNFWICNWNSEGIMPRIAVFLLLSFKC